MAEALRERRHTLYDRRHITMAQSPSLPHSNLAGSTPFIRRISWPAVWGGAFVAMGIQLMLGLIAPRTSLLGGQIPLIGISIRTGVWYLLYTMIAFYTAGWTSSMLAASNLTSIEQRLHGLVTWAVSNLFVFLLLGMAPVSGSLPSGWTMTSGGWMFGGMVVGLIAALFGAKNARSESEMDT